MKTSRSPLTGATEALRRGVRPALAPCPLARPRNCPGGLKPVKETKPSLPGHAVSKPQRIKEASRE